MEFKDIQSHFETNHRGVITTFQANGAGHSSIVVCGAYQGNAAFVIVNGTSAKVRNLRRDPRCTVMSVTENWRTCAPVFSHRHHGTARIPPQIADLSRGAVHDYKGGVALIGSTDHYAGMTGPIGLECRYHSSVIGLKMALNVFELHNCTSLNFPGLNHS